MAYRQAASAFCTRNELSKSLICTGNSGNNGNSAVSGRLFIKAVDLTDYLRSVKLTACRPWLRPMSSMTEEERNEYKRIAPGIVFDEGIKFPNISQLDWLLSNHFDFRCLISLGLANEVTKENNPYK